MSQATFQVVKNGKKFICFDPKHSLYNTIPLFRKLMSEVEDNKEYRKALKEQYKETSVK